MLIIRRRLGESILIGDDIEIHITDISSNRVKLGIIAPRQVPILRNEVKLTAEENQAAAREFSLDELAGLTARLRKPAR